MESTKGSYAKEWANWEKRLREVLFSNAEYLNSIQLAQKNPKVEAFLQDKQLEHNLKKTHLTLPTREVMALQR
ncbi:hypothetical protein GH714_003046 [Hevea brasiliensis]|nr:hypothetical protein GH714_003046 [Hevea brasiliensis]